MSKKPTGRPTKYKPEYCEEAIRYMGGGYSLTGFAGKIGVSRQTVYEWAEVHPEFSDALNTARAASAAWWEDRAVDIATGGEGNASVVIFGLKNRVADEWREKSVTEIGGIDGGPIPVTGFDIRIVNAPAGDADPTAG